MTSVNIKQLPDELIDLIFLNLPSVDVAIVQQTCKQWYAIAQNHPKLWRNTRSFFEKYYPVIDEYSQMKHHEDIMREKRRCKILPPSDVCMNDGRKKFFDGLEALMELSGGKLDEILIDFSCFQKNDESKIVDSKQYYRSRRKVQKVLDFISVSDVKLLWIKDDLCTHIVKRHRNRRRHIYPRYEQERITPVPKSVLGCSKLTELKLSTPDERMRTVPYHPTKGSPFAKCCLKRFDIDGRYFEMFQEDESLFRVLEGVEHFQLRCDGWISDATTIFGFLSRISSSLKVLEIFGTKYSHMSTHYLGTSPFLNEVEVMLPRVTRVAILAKFYDNWDDFDRDEEGNTIEDHGLSETQTARVLHNRSIDHVLVFQNLQSLTLERTFPDRPMLLANRIESLKLIDINQESLQNVLRHIPKFDNLTFTIRCIERLKGIQQVQLPDSITSFTVNLEIFDCDETLNKWFQDRVGSSENKSMAELEQNTPFCNLKTTIMSSDSAPTVFSKDEWIGLVKELQGSKLKCRHHHDMYWH